MRRHRRANGVLPNRDECFNRPLQKFILPALCCLITTLFQVEQSHSQEDHHADNQKQKSATISITIRTATTVNESAVAVMEQMARELEELHQLHKHALVRVRAETQLGIFNGTGFLIDHHGHILTASSLVPDDGDVSIEINDIYTPATIVGIDRPSSIALLKVTNQNATPSLQFRHGTPLPQGAAVVIIGFPFHGDSSPLFSIISGLDRTLPDGKMLCITHHRMNVPLTPGMLGSPVVDSSGHVAGIVTGTAGNGRLTYSLPTPALRRVLADLSEHGKVRRGWVGMELEERRSIETGKTFMLITKIHPNTPAHKAGLLPDDIVKMLDGREINDRFDLIEASFYTRIGDQVPVFITRNGEDLTFHVNIVERPAEVPFVEIRKPPGISRVMSAPLEQ